MRTEGTPLSGVRVIEPVVHRDARGAFFEAWHSGRYGAVLGAHGMAQCNLSRSRRGVVRGLHFQHPNAQAKLVTVAEGAVFDVAVDVRRGSPTFGHWFGAELTAGSARQLFIPEGFAHGFQALTDEAVVLYLSSRVYDPAVEQVIRWDDPAIGVAWPEPVTTLSERDRAAPRLAELLDRLPAW